MKLAAKVAPRKEFDSQFRFPVRLPIVVQLDDVSARNDGAFAHKQRNHAERRPRRDRGLAIVDGVLSP
jgi:hypothetical protein